MECRAAARPSLPGFRLFRALEQHRERGLGKAGAGIARDRMNDLTVAMLQQRIRDEFSDLRAACNRQQMCLALGLGDGDEIAGREACGLRQDRSGNGDILIQRQPAHRFRGGVLNRRETPAELRARLAPDRPDRDVRARRRTHRFAARSTDRHWREGDRRRAQRCVRRWADPDCRFELIDQRYLRGHSQPSRPGEKSPLSS